MKGINGFIAAGRQPVLHYAVRNNKFSDEKVCMETKDYLVQFDGILLSHTKPSSANERFDLLTGLYRQHGAQLTAHLKGQFNLVIWDKAAQKVLLTNDLLSRRPMYYCMEERQLYYAASYYDLLDLMSENGHHRPEVNAESLCSMIHSGILTGTETWAQGISYLDAYEAIVWDLPEGRSRVVSVTPPPVDVPDEMEAAVQRFDQLFSSAVSAQFAKNAEYGYEHFIALSGGMDSRACLLKAVQCGFDRSITCFNYSQTGSVDHSVSQQLAFDHHLDYLFYPMDAAVFITRLSQAMDANECQQSAIGSTGAGTLARLLDTSRTGVMHVGLCGGELMGDLVNCSFSSPVEKVLVRLGLRAPAQAACRFQQRDYLNNVRACQNFASMFLDQCETVSPFLDEDVVRFVTALSPQLLYRRGLYREWMKQCVPNNYPTTMFCGPVSISPVQELLRKTADLIIRRIAGASKRDMNPIERWFRVNPHLAHHCQQEYLAGMQALEADGLADSFSAMLRESWRTDGEHRLYTLTAIRALRDLTSRFH